MYVVKILLIFLFILNFTFIFCQGVYSNGARNISLANATAALNDEWYFYNNPGVVPISKNITLGASYENRFLVKEMQSQSLVGIIPMKNGVISFGSQLYGYSQFRSFKSGVGYAMQLAEFVSAGIQLNYQGIRLNQNYGGYKTVTAEVGVLAKLNKKLSCGFSVWNIGNAILDDYQNDRFTNTMRLGFNYKLSQMVTILAELEKNSLYPLNLKMATEYKPSENVFIRGGCSLQPVSFSFGFGYLFAQSFSLDFGTTYHQPLGWSPAVSCVYKILK